MTVGEAIRKARTLRHAAMSEESGMYYKWLTEVEQEVTEALNLCEPVGEEIPEGWESGPWLSDPELDEDDAEKELLLPVRFEMIYVYKLMCEIDLTVGETDKYNQDAAMYNQMMAEWKAWLRRKRVPQMDHRKYWRLA